MSARRYRQLCRVLLLVELLAPLRNGATVAELTTDVCENIGPVDQRTIYRDLETLEALGLLERFKRPEDSGHRWRWQDGGLRAAVVRGAAVGSE